MADNILERFWDLASVEELERRNAAVSLLSCLEELQTKQSEGLCDELEYSLQRLVKGLASHRKGARQGFFIALTELMAKFPEVPVSAVLQLVKKHLSVGGSAKAQEERGALFGRAFALLSLVQSGRLKQAKEDGEEVLIQLRNLGRKKSYLSEFCAVVMGDLVSQWPHKLVKELALSQIVPEGERKGGWEVCMPDMLYVLLMMEREHENHKWFKNFLKTNFNGCRSLTSQANFKHLATILAESTSAHPRLHSVWPLVIDLVKKKDKDFGDFWATVVEGSLLPGSHEKRFLAFKLVEYLLPSLESSEVPVVFSDGLLRCLVTNSASPGNYLHTAAVHLLSEIVSQVETRQQDQQSDVGSGARGEGNDGPSSFAIAVLTHLQRNTGTRFDHLTRSKTIDSIVTKLDVSGVRHYLHHLMDIFCDPSSVTVRIGVEESESLSAASTQLWVIDEVLALVRNRRVRRESHWLLEASEFILLHSNFSCSSTTSPLPPGTSTGTLSPGTGTGTSTSQHTKQQQQCVEPLDVLDESVHTGCCERLQSALSEVCCFVAGGSNAASSGVERSLQPGVMEGGKFFLAALLRFASHLVKENVTMLQPFSDQESNSWGALTEIVEELDAKQGDSTPEESAFLLLFSAVGLYFLYGSERDKLLQNVEELRACYQEMRLACGLAKNRKKKQRRRETVTLLDSPGWIDVLTDVLLGFLSQASQLWRSVSGQVFRLVCSHVTSSSLQLITQVLQPQSKEELMDKEEEEGEGEKEEKEREGKEEEEGEKDEKEEEQSNESASSGSGESEDDGSEDGMEGGGGEIDLAAFRADVKKALGLAAMDSEGEESDEPLDDDAMMEVDDALAAAFKLHLNRRPPKKQKKEEEKTVVHFKLRALDLVEIFIRRQPSNPLVLSLVPVLLKVIHYSQNKKLYSPLLERATHLFKGRLCHLKDYPRKGLDASLIHSQLQECLQYLHKATAVTAPPVTQGCMLLLKVLRGATQGPSVPPPPTPSTISPLTTRAGRKRRREREEEEEEEKDDKDSQDNKQKDTGLLDVAMVTAWLSELLMSYLTKKNSSVPPLFFLTLAERFPLLVWQLLDISIEGLSKTSSQFRKNQVYDMLTLLLSQRIDSETIGEIFSQCLPGLLKHVQQALPDVCQKSTKLLRPILKMTLKVVGFSCREEFKDAICDTEGLVQALEVVMDTKSSSMEAVRECEKVLSALQKRMSIKESVVQKKRKKKN